MCAFLAAANFIVACSLCCRGALLCTMRRSREHLCASGSSRDSYDLLGSGNDVHK